MTKLQTLEKSIDDIHKGRSQKHSEGCVCGKNVGGTSIPKIMDDTKMAGIAAKGRDKLHTTPLGLKSKM